ncbi:MAG TPA: DMT family transporter [Streptosporangiaceae bacterium]|jgi:drug/metabolite transporter (DMT)-like permease|nr:DMT family transporter [Streptosporangiaceae bacterium]
MNGAAETTIAVLAGLAAACSFGVGVALQHRQAQLAPVGGREPLRLLAHLARQRLWLVGIALNAAAYGLLALALAFGPLALVAPIAATDLLFALPLAARWSRRPVRPAGWAGCILIGSGVSVFLVASPPSAGRADAPVQDWALVFAAVALVAVAAVTAAQLTRGPARASLLALAAGTVFGLTSALTLSVTRLLARQGLGHLLGHWQPWALAALGAVGLLLSASTFRAGPLSASLPVIDSAEPISAVLIGTVVFGERLAASPAGLALQLAGAAAAVGGIILLGRSSLIARAYSYAASEHGLSAGPGSRPRHDRPLSQPPAVTPEHSVREGI